MTIKQHAAAAILAAIIVVLCNSCAVTVGFDWTGKTDVKQERISPKQ